MDVFQMYFHWEKKNELYFFPIKKNEGKIVCACVYVCVHNICFRWRWKDSFFGIPLNYIVTTQLFGNYKCNYRVVTVLVTTSYH